MRLFTRSTSMLLLLLIANAWLASLNLYSAVAESAMIRVPSDYSTIQAAINAAQNGDTVFVSAGTYLENIIVNKTVSLVGESVGTTIIDGGGLSYIVNVTVSDVVVSGFTLRSSGPESPGIYLDSCNNATIRGNIIMNSFFGVWFQNSNGSSVHSNTFFNNTDGVYMAYSSGNLAEGNTVTNNSQGIRLDWFSNSNVFTGNLVANNTDGFFVSTSDGNTFRNNRIMNNTDGLFLNGAKSSTVYENKIADNTEGVFLFRSNSSVFYRNNFSNNTSAHAFSFNSADNVWDNGAEGNYWSGYVGEDLNGDGIIDAPYEIDASNKDDSPLYEPWSLLRFFDVESEGATHKVAVFSNSTVGRQRSFGFDFLPYSRQIRFNVTGPSGSVGFFNVTVPKQLLLGTSWRWHVFLNGSDVSQGAVVSENATYTSLYLTYGLSTLSVRVVNEPSTDIFPPKADARFNQTVYLGDLVMFDGALSSDNVGVVSYEWDFGDGNVTSVSVTVITHVFAVVGTYTVKLTVKDAAGSAASDTVTVTVLERPEPFPWWILLLVVVLVVGGLIGVGIFVLRRKRRS